MSVNADGEVPQSVEAAIQAAVDSHVFDASQLWSDSPPPALLKVSVGAGGGAVVLSSVAIDGPSADAFGDSGALETVAERQLLCKIVLNLIEIYMLTYMHR